VPRAGLVELLGTEQLHVVFINDMRPGGGRYKRRRPVLVEPSCALRPLPPPQEGAKAPRRLAPAGPRALEPRRRRRRTVRQGPKTLSTVSFAFISSRLCASEITSSYFTPNERPKVAKIYATVAEKGVTAALPVVRDMGATVGSLTGAAAAQGRARSPGVAYFRTHLRGFKLGCLPAVSGSGTTKKGNE